MFREQSNTIMSANTQPQPYSLDHSNLNFSQTDAQTSKPVPVPNMQVGKEPFDTSSMKMSDNISTQPPSNDLYGLRTQMTPASHLDSTNQSISNKYDYDLSGNLAGIPNTYGYIPSTQEVYSQDITDMLSQERTTLTLAALSGASIIVLGIMLLSRGRASPPAAP